MNLNQVSNLNFFCKLSNMKSQLDSNARGGSLNTEELTQLKSQLNNAIQEKDDLQTIVNK